MNTVTKRKTVLFGLLCMLIMGTIVTGCSKDESNEPQTGNIDIAVGTYKGKMTVYVPDLIEYFDAVITVTKDSEGKLKVSPKSGEAYSNATPKVFPVIYRADAGGGTKAVSTNTGAVEGIFLYIDDGKTLNLITEQQQADEAYFSFEGVKQ